MATPPSHGEPRPAVQGFRRTSSQYASLPTRNLSFHERAGLNKADAAAEVLYSHPSARIYKFAPPTESIKSSSTAKLPHDTDYPVDTVETLPWRSRTETLLATGPMMIEKVRGSTNFLKCGDMMHAVLRNSQCWCVDGESKFVMRVGPFRYYRIELPSSTEGDRQKVEELKVSLGKILRYERTPCPFVRAFQVDLPEDAITPRRKGPWKRRESLESPEFETPPLRRMKPTRTWSLRGTPPNSFPSRFEQAALERPRTATTPNIGGKSDWNSLRSRSSVDYASSEDGAYSDRLDTKLNGRSENEESTIIPKTERNEVEMKNETHTVVPRLAEMNRGNEEHTREQLTEMTSDEQGLSQKNVGELDIGRTSSAEEDSTKKGTAADHENDLTMEIVKQEKEQSVPCPLAQPLDLGIGVDATKIELPEQTGLEKEFLEHEEQFPAPKDGQDTSLASEILPNIIAPFRGDSNETKLIPIGEVSEDQSPPILAEDTDREPESESLYDYLLTEVKKEPPMFRDLRGQFSTENMNFDSAYSAKWLSGERTKTKDDDAMSTISSDSFHTLASSIQHDENSPRLEAQPDINSARSGQHRREISEVTVTASSVEDVLNDGTLALDKSELPALLHSSASDSSWPDVQTPSASGADFESRQRLNHSRSLAPPPPPSTIVAQANHEHNREIPQAILRKAATLVVAKPIEVAVLVVHVLARIVGGATVNDLMSGELFRRPGTRRTASGSFEMGRPAKQNTVSRNVSDSDESLSDRNKSLCDAADDDRASQASLD